MADNKKYYYLKLKENFYDRDEIVILESLPDGYLYSNILLKLYLRSLKNDGRLMFNDRIPFNSEMLSKITRHPVAVIEKAITIFKEMDLIEILDNGAIYMLDIQNFIGQSSSEADRIRKYRQKIESEKLFLTNENPSVQMYDKCTPEIELERKQEREREQERYCEESQMYTFPSWLNEKSIDMVKKGNPDNYEKRIPIAYLNQVTNRNFKYVDKNMSSINARFKEGYTLEDFKKVIDVKSAEWLSDESMSKYLRPETLFGTKFDGYLNTSMPIRNNSHGISDPNADKFAGMEDWN
ncbi:phage replisome organizer N-terminal domain-containing protein [Streptococcus gallolyticus]|uniref:phage replisome organizer N-terminal domain-containing protein n=1 Tax=Streptococcus gallolyticus TaxID=315405 RepID=UPI000E421FD9|nr:phage replisome organizer N-terminal domain-containing protein [Streptococcus gallolyticus]RGC38174.1 prephenate dehydrogenase [Streptococcus gallolyticus]